MNKDQRFKYTVLIFLGISAAFILALLGQVQIQQKKVQQKSLTMVPDLKISHNPENPTNHDRICFNVESRNPGSIEKIVFFQNARVVGEDSSYPWSFSGGPYPVKTHTFGAVAYNLSGKRVSKKYISVKVTFPEVKLSITHCPASPTTRDKIRFIVNARDRRDIYKVVFYVDSVKVGEDVSHPWTFDSGPYPAGTFTFGAQAYNVSGKEICSRYTSIQVK